MSQDVSQTSPEPSKTPDLSKASPKKAAAGDRPAGDFYLDVERRGVDAQDPVQSPPNGGFATRTEIAVGLIHLAHHTAVNGFVTKLFRDSQKLIIFRHAISPAK